ncbi:MAG: hypothetical protein GYA14_09245 [Ignavibacteria bacterium]|nr:hypothetical protein [Ignavibacteria bacterium]
MKILFSVSNTDNSIGFYQKRGLSHLKILDTRDKKIYYVKLPEDLKDKGLTGLAMDTDSFYVISHTREHPYLLKLSRRNLELKKRAWLSQVKDPHQILVSGNKLLICSSGTNSIESYNKDTFSYLGTF